MEPGYGEVIVTGTGTKGTDSYYGEKKAYFFIRPVDYQLEAVYSQKLKELRLPGGWMWQDQEFFVGDVTEADADGRAFKADFRMGDIEKEDVDSFVKVSPKDINDAGHKGDGEISFTSSNDEVFKVEKAMNDFNDAEDGRLTATGIGEAILNIRLTETANYKGAELVYRVVVSAVSIGEQDLVMKQSSYEYTGQQIVPELEVIVDGVTLTEGEDYTAVYGENVKAGKNAGSVTVTGIHDYSGTVKVFFGYILKEGTDYTVAYGENIHAGTAVVTGIGKFSGTAQVKFTILQAVNPQPAPDEIKAVYGQKLSTITLPDGWT